MGLAFCPALLGVKVIGTEDMRRLNILGGRCIVGTLLGGDPAGGAVGAREGLVVADLDCLGSLSFAGAGGGVGVGDRRKFSCSSAVLDVLSAK